jgi:hypothetical protein
MLDSVKSFVKFFVKPKAFAQGQNLDGRLRMHHLFRTLHASHAREREELLKSLQPDKPLQAIPENQGFRAIDDLDPDLVKQVHQAAKDTLKGLNLDELLEKSQNKHLVTFTLNPQADPNSPFMKLALHPAVLKMVGDYLGTLPVIENILFWYSPNKQNINRSSQYYHLDAQDVRTLQMFVFIEDIDDESGPFILIDADESEKLARMINYRKKGSTRRIDDELISQNIPPEKIRTLKGPAGSVFIADSDRCFHYGSRKASKPRFMMAIQYFSPYAFSVPFKWWKGLPFAQNPNMHRFNKIERLVLGAPN